VADKGESGIVLNDLAIGTASGALRPTFVQRQGKRAMPVEEFLRGNPPVKIGDRLS
jgi:methionyl-tRNA formyltransferase